jgi:hypothetical protein
MSEQLAQILEPVGSLARMDSKTEVIPTGEETTAAMRRMGGVTVGEHELQDLATIGAHVQRVGVFRAVRGRLLLNQELLTNSIQNLTETIKELKEKPEKNRASLASMAKLSRSIRDLSAQLRDSQQLLLEVERLSSP